jgi:hypothetical protein
VAGKRLHPDVLQRMPSHEVNAILPDHIVCVEHRRGEASRPKGNHYVITIEGPRLGGQWRFWSGALEQLARASFNSSGSAQPLRMQSALRWAVNCDLERKRPFGYLIELKSAPIRVAHLQRSRRAPDTRRAVTSRDEVPAAQTGSLARE